MRVIELECHNCSSVFRKEIQDNEIVKNTASGVRLITKLDDPFPKPVKCSSCNTTSKVFQLPQGVCCGT